MKLHLSASLIALACSLGLVRSHAGEQVFFAFDDHSIPWQHNLKVTLVPATKHPANPVLRRGPEGTADHGGAGLYGTVIKDGGKFRMWYVAFDDDKENKVASARWRAAYAESPDGVKWIKPNLGIVEFAGAQKKAR